MTDVIRYEVEDGVAIVTIARPDVRNAMSIDVFDGLYEAGRRASADAAARAVVVSGDGAAFSSGIDTTIFSTGSAGQARDAGAIDVPRFQRAFTVFEEIPKPVIAAVAGAAFGAGLQLAIACDLRVATSDARFSVFEIRWGLIPDLGGTTRLPRLVGSGRAKEMAFTGRIVEADEALGWGLVNRIVAPGEHRKTAVEWAREIVAGPPLTIAGIKRLVNGAFDVPVSSGLEREAVIQRRIIASSDFAEAVAARLEQRAPRYAAR